ncbi:YokU family protein [Bacillus sp. CGMCC 1.16541]|uniref:YokU family protein n=1 Tax=Bacillus sp. CGMCC 1.16541 TaxID=2185143 RepID=UPI001EF6DA49|nr:YokU family protein [Bacillus sp. CGMCC 1.16541]
MKCEWCDEEGAFKTTNIAYWELPDGSRSIELLAVPCVKCPSCGMEHQEEEVVEKIETQLLLIDTKKLQPSMTYDEFMSIPRWLKRNYFHF